jgi:dATP pyrophosphohydrolase
MQRLVDVYPYRENQGGLELLVLKRSPGVVYSDQWRMVGGKVNEAETSAEAALRELKEETGCGPNLFWVLPSVNQFYDHNIDSVRQIPAFAARMDNDSEIKLNHEHDEYRWITEDEIDTYIVWPEQQRLMKLLTTILRANKLIEEWIITLRQ